MATTNKRTLKTKSGEVVVLGCWTCANRAELTGRPCPPLKVNRCQPTGEPGEFVDWTPDDTIAQVDQDGNPTGDPGRPGYLDGGLDDGRYVVTKRNGDPIDPAARYFVLRYDKDPHALAAVFTYARSVREDNPTLADELVAAAMRNNDADTIDAARAVDKAERESVERVEDMIALGVQDQTVHVLDVLAFTIHANAKAHGFWTGDPLDRNVGEMIALIHSELSEALEGHRKNAADDHLPEFDSLTVELADAVIRILDLAAGRQLNFAEALLSKMRFNLGRPHKHGKDF
jgi:NTP pyrophosphatase (non-canonical NTP hydrolase)